MYQNPNGQIDAHVPAGILFQTTVNAAYTDQSDQLHHSRVISVPVV